MLANNITAAGLAVHQNFSYSINDKSCADFDELQKFSLLIICSQDGASVYLCKKETYVAA